LLGILGAFMEVNTTNSCFYHRKPKNSEFLSQKCLNSKCSQQGICAEVSYIFRLSCSIIFVSLFLLYKLGCLNWG